MQVLTLRSVPIISSLAILGSTFGCDPKSSDDASSDAGEVTPCIDAVTVLDANAESPLGFSAETLLDGKLGTRQTTLVFEDEPTLLAAEVAGLVLPLEVTLAWTGGEARWIQSETNPEYDYGGQLGGFVECLDRFEVDVVLSLVTEGGELDEHVPTPLRATAADRATLTRGRLPTPGMDLFPPALQGSLDPSTMIADPSFEVLGLVTMGTWFEDLAGGSLWVEMQGELADVGGVVGFGVVASWGDDIPSAEEP